MHSSSMRTVRSTPLWTEWQTGVKTLPCRNYVADGKKYNLDRHVVLHTGNFRWYCELCRRGFAQKDLNSVHMRSHEGLKYICEYCGKSFNQQMALKYHLSEHTGNYRLKCDYCNEGFNLLRQYNKHILKHQTAWSGTSTLRVDASAFLRPQTKFAKVMFSQVSVCPRGGGEVLPLVRGGSSTPSHTSWAETPWSDTPLPSAWWDTRPLPSACWGTHPGRRTPLPSACWDTHPPPSACWDTVKKQVVCIPLECILVSIVIWSDCSGLLVIC